jgi:hypothetical protein
MIDSILFWDDVAFEAHRASHTSDGAEPPGGTLGAQALAIVHLAMYDAYVAIEKPADFAPYLPGLPPVPAGASALAAVAGAAHEALSVLFPDQRSFFDLKLAEAALPGCPGQQFGREIASAVLEDHADDPSSQNLSQHLVDPEDLTPSMHGPLHAVCTKGLPRTVRGRGGTRHGPGRDHGNRCARWSVVGSVQVSYLPQMP